MKKIIILISAFIFLMSCGGKKVKILVMGKGDIKIEGNKVIVQDGSGHIEKEMIISKGESVTFEANGTSSSEKVFENGYYILNLKTDTVVGALQKLGTDLNNGKTITFEQLKLIVDSLNNLVIGKNVSAENKNFFILPNSLQPVSSNLNSKIYGPYKKVSAVQELGPNGEEPEIYKFYTNKEMRELIADKAKMIPASIN